MEYKVDRNKGVTSNDVFSMVPGLENYIEWLIENAGKKPDIPPPTVGEFDGNNYITNVEINCK